uniref:Pigment dispersing factor n=1 Tax=Carausius morosus TaxID=7022 RepID=A0A6G4ZWI0_CARMO|nr:pigment dispersing factor [Carausius morosus]
MKQLAILVLCVVFLRLLHQTAGLQYDDDRYLDGESSWQRRNTVTRELATWIMQLLHRGEPMLCNQKRNSELINSLLALPKVLNDAGRK